MMAWRPATTAIALSVVVIGGFCGCAGDESNPVAVRVGKQAIGKEDVDHWASVIARGALVAGELDPQQSPRRQALSMLIDARWLIGEALRSGLRLSSSTLARLVKEHKNAISGGPGGFKALLAQSGETEADVEFEVTARWAALALAQRLARSVEQRAGAEVPATEVASFYHAHLADYYHREQRFYDLQESIPSRAQAVALAKKLGNGARFGIDASKEKPFRPLSFEHLPGQAVAYRAVFAAKVGVLTGPIPLQGHWCLFVIRRIVPAGVQPFSAVRDSIERKLLAEPRRRARTQLVDAYRRRWLSQTDCRPGYVVQKCRQYTGPRAPESAPFAGY
ncbi:MAG TPA: peptidylprolyl isomerase [Solirubrobacteraceae bacterium]|nr:peptidylprolyl isomerase [Solirubrobacteraceae bacterium]